LTAEKHPFVQNEIFQEEMGEYHQLFILVEKQKQLNKILTNPFHSLEYNFHTEVKNTMPETYKLFPSLPDKLLVLS